MKFFWRSVNQKIFFFEINVSKLKCNHSGKLPSPERLENDSFSVENKLLDFLIFKHRKKSLCRGVNWKNFLQ